MTAPELEPEQHQIYGRSETLVYTTCEAYERVHHQESCVHSQASGTCQFYHGKVWGLGQVFLLSTTNVNQLCVYH